MGSRLPAPPNPFASAGLPAPPGTPGFNPLDPFGKGQAKPTASAPATPSTPAKMDSPTTPTTQAKRVKKGFSYGMLPGNAGAGRGAFGTLLGGGMPGGKTLLGG